MTIYPFIVHVGGLTITGYGIMMMAGFLMGGWVYATELTRRGIDTGIAWDTVVLAIIGGLAGSKLYYAISVADWRAFFTRGGLVWYGGFFGAAAAVFAWMGWKRLPIRTLLDAISPALAVGYLLGRVGCFLVNDDFGRPTTLPWGMIFPHGAPPSTAINLERMFHVTLPPGTPPLELLAVHPTQLYEIALTFVVFVLLWRWREHRHAPGWLFGVFLIGSSVERIIVEVFRAKDDRVLGPVSVAQLLSMGLIAVGVWVMTMTRHRPAAIGHQEGST